MASCRATRLRTPIGHAPDGLDGPHVPIELDVVPERMQRPVQLGIGRRPVHRRYFHHVLGVVQSVQLGVNVLGRGLRLVARDEAVDEGIPDALSAAVQASRWRSTLARIFTASKGIRRRAASSTRKERTCFWVVRIFPWRAAPSRLPT